MVGARKCYLHWVGKGSSKGTKVVIEQHVVSLRPMVDEQDVSLHVDIKDDYMYKVEYPSSNNVT
jgi:hypothetical protein